MSHGKCTKHEDSIVWTQHGLLHRGAGKPAWVHNSGIAFWYAKGHITTHTRDYCTRMKYDEQMTAVMILKYGEKFPENIKDI